MSETRAAVDAFNAATESSRLLTEAKPDQERCRWCNYRVICEPFWNALTTEWVQRSTLGLRCRFRQIEGRSVRIDRRR